MLTNLPQRSSQFIYRYTFIKEQITRAFETLSMTVALEIKKANPTNRKGLSESTRSPFQLSILIIFKNYLLLQH